MPGKLTTHVIDTARGRPASGIKIELHRIESSTLTLVSRATTGAKGRTDQPLMEGETMTSGLYELHFHLGEYFKEGFLEIVPVRFRIADPSGHYHVPLLCSPGHTARTAEANQHRTAACQKYPCESVSIRG